MVDFYISKNVLQAINDNTRPMLTDLLFCKRGAILMDSKDMVGECTLDDCALCCEVKRGARVTLKKMV